MREPVRDRERLEHIVEAIANILDFADGKTKEELEAKRKSLSPINRRKTLNLG